MHVFHILTEGQIPRRYHAGQIIYLQGTQAEEFYYLCSGAVRSFITSEDGEERVLTTHHAGDLMGEASFFDACPRVSSAIAEEDSTAVTIDRARLNALFTRHPELAMPMLQYLARTVRLLSNHMDSAFLSADRRIARCLLDRAKGNDSPLILSCTHEGIGRAVGSSRVTVSRTLSDFAKRGWLSTSYRTVTILDRAALADFANGG